MEDQGNATQSQVSLHFHQTAVAHIIDTEWLPVFQIMDKSIL